MYSPFILITKIRKCLKNSEQKKKAKVKFKDYNIFFPLIPFFFYFQLVELQFGCLLHKKKIPKIRIGWKNIMLAYLPNSR